MAAAEPAPAPAAAVVLASPSFSSTSSGSISPLTWAFEPAPPSSSYAVGDGVLTIRPAAKTDYWSNTFYGFPDPQPHNGPFAFVRAAGDFVATVKTTTFPRNRYDQAGLMVRVPGSVNDWIKTSIEYIPDGPSHLGSVVTNLGFSDWATQDFEPTGAGAGENPSTTGSGSSSGTGAATGATRAIRIDYEFRIRRLKSDYIVEARASPALPWSQIRMAHLHADPGTEGSEVEIGVYACSPLGEGLEARFADFKVVAGRV
jgi:regulation of enolase protein 1 (concanavalin A-like superfamily)